jgi:VIT1/CCC1 family predicted Fe2+/Mn2+ transporter
MKHSVKVGFSFGLTSGIITTLGLMVGLNASTNSKLVVIGGIVTIAVADALSDAMGIHISEESENKHTEREVWESTVTTFLSKFVFSSLFIIPVLLLELSQAIPLSIALGLFLILILSYFIGKDRPTPTWRIITEHLVITVVVIGVTQGIGQWISVVFG